MTDARIHIDELGHELIPTREHILAAMKDGQTVRLTVEQILDLFLGYPQFQQKAGVTDLEKAIKQVRTRYQVRAATTENITISTSLNPGDTIDGVVLADGDLVLVRAQTIQSQNGIYRVAAAPARAPEFETFDDHTALLTLVSEGDVNAGSIWQSISTAGGTLGTTSIQFVAPAAASPTKTAPDSADRFWIWDSVGGRMKGLPVGNLGRVSRLALRVFTASGTYTPDPNLLYADCEAVGAGGGGGGARGMANSYFSGGGGGSGAYSRRILTKAQIGAFQAVTIGVGGRGGGTGPSGGGLGGSTTIGTLVAAAGGGGGSGGSSGSSPQGGSGGSMSGGSGDLVLPGRAGRAGSYAANAAPGSGGADSVFGPGAPDQITSGSGTQVDGAAGQFGGGGSGGAVNNSTGGALGGAGGNGLVVITEYCAE